VDDFERLRGRLFGIAYRMTGAATDAEEILQDAWLRWQAAERSSVRDVDAYLAKTVTNLSIKQLTSARARRETYVGAWLPEPVLTSVPDSPLDIAAERESVSLALLLLLERLTPAERAAYVLHQAFAYTHREVADLIGTTEANARQLTSRASKRISPPEPPRRLMTVERQRWREFVERFFAAAQSGELEELEQLLAADVVSRADGGGKVTAARNPVHGRSRVARYLIGTLQRFGAGITPYLAEANGEPVLVAVGPDGLVAICFFELTSEGVHELNFVMNPDKLAFAATQLSRIGGLPGQSW
jgi:RNA polymerase sigma-70 factor (ECF subfamily)